MADGGAGAGGYNYKPCAAMMATQCIFAAMMATQCIFAAMTLWVKAAFGRGMSPTVFVVYRQAFATLVLAPISIVTNRARLKEMRLGMKAFSLVLLAALFGQETVKIREASSTTKIFGTFVCVGGAITIAFFKGLKLPRDPSMLVHDEYEFSSDWVMGALFLVGSSSCWSLWIILQSAVVALFLLPDRGAWRIHSLFELSCYAFAGVLGSGVVFYLQSWCVSVRGPLYSAMFTPLCTVLTTALSAAILHEQLHVGSLVAAAAVITGLYIVLWGKAEDARMPALQVAPTPRPRRKWRWEPHPHSHARQHDLENTLAAPLMGHGAMPGRELAQARN